MIRGTRMRIGIALVAALATAGIAAGCGDDDDDGGGDESRDLINEGTLFVGLDTPYPPFAEGQPPNATGYDVEVLNAIAENLGLTVEYQDTGFPTIFRDVAAGPVRHRRRGVDDQARAREGRRLHRPLLR